jgi:tetratricopeptide (TPR) repeat protein
MELLGDKPLETYKIYELNELFLLRTMIFEEMGEFKKGYKFVAKFTKYIVDDTRRNEALYRLYNSAGLTKKALEALEELLMLNSNNEEYYRQILQVEGVQMDDAPRIAEILQKYEKLQKPSVTTHLKLSLDLLPAGDEFKSRLERFIRPQIIKGVPSVINNMPKIYADPAKAKILGAMLSEMCENMEKEMVLRLEDEEE